MSTRFILFGALAAIVLLCCGCINSEISTGTFPLGKCNGEITVKHDSHHALVNASITAPAMEGAWVTVVMDNEEDSYYMQEIYVSESNTYVISHQFEIGDMVWVNITIGENKKNQCFLSA